jgi:hypothetical protein
MPVSLPNYRSSGRAGSVVPQLPSVAARRTSTPTKILLDCFMVRPRLKVDTQVPTSWLGARARTGSRVTRVTTETGLPPIMHSHSV